MCLEFRRGGFSSLVFSFQFHLPRNPLHDTRAKVREVIVDSGTRAAPFIFAGVLDSSSGPTAFVNLNVLGFSRSSRPR